MAHALEGEWNEKLRAHATAQADYERHSQQQHGLADEESKRKIFSLDQASPASGTTLDRAARAEADAPAADRRCDAAQDRQDHCARSLAGWCHADSLFERPVPIAQIRKARPELVAEIDRLLDEHCDREVADILNQQGRRTWQNQLFNLQKVAWIRGAYHLKSRFGRLRERGLLTAKEMSAKLKICETTVYEWARAGLLRRIICDARSHSLSEPLQDLPITKGRGGRGAQQPTFTVAKSRQGAI